MISRFINLKYQVETGILQGSPISPIFFLIYLSSIFLEIERQILDIICQSFINNLGFLVYSKSMLKIKELVEKTRKIALN